MSVSVLAAEVFAGGADGLFLALPMWRTKSFLVVDRGSTLVAAAHGPAGTEVGKQPRPAEPCESCWRPYFCEARRHRSCGRVDALLRVQFAGS